MTTHLSVIDPIQLEFTDFLEAKIIPVHSVPLTINIPTGSTIMVETTCDTGEKIRLGTANWQQWPQGSQAGPFTDTLTAMVVALRVTAYTTPAVCNIVR